jgi:hypothetical protein
MTARRVLISLSIYAIGLTACFPTGGQSVGWARTRDLTEAEARQLTIEALDPSARGLPGLALDQYENIKNPDFYEFAVTWDPGEREGSVMVGFFAVSRATGDVWRLVVCRQVDSPGLRRLQHAIRRRIALGKQEYHQLHGKAACEP